MTMTVETTFTGRARRRGVVFNFLRYLLRGLYMAHRRNVTERALCKLNERDLKDIGLTRTSTGYDLVTWDPRSRNSRPRSGR